MPPVAPPVVPPVPPVTPPTPTPTPSVWVAGNLPGFAPLAAYSP